MFGSSSTTRTRGPPSRLLLAPFTRPMLIEFPGRLLRNLWGSASILLRWPARDAMDRALVVHQSRRQAMTLEPRDRLSPHHDGGGRGDVRVDARRGNDRHGAPAALD